MATARIERRDHTATIHVRGDLVRSDVVSIYDTLRSATRRREVKHVIVDLAETERLDSAGAATIALAMQLATRAGKLLTVAHASDQHRIALELAPPPVEVPEPELPGALENLGERILKAGDAARALALLVGDIARQSLGLVTRRSRLPAHSVTDQIVKMGTNGVFIVALMMFLLGMTMGFQGGVQMQRFGARPYVADLIGLSLVRELGPVMAAVIIAGRTGAAIAAELGTMRVRSEIDALSAMGINPTRYLVIPRLLSLTFVQPALTLMAIFIGMAGGMLVVGVSFDLSPGMFWARVVERVLLDDFTFGLSKSIVFAWCIGTVACHFGMRAKSDAGSVGIATTRTVVASIFLIVVVDAIFATISTVVRY